MPLKPEPWTPSQRLAYASMLAAVQDDREEYQRLVAGGMKPWFNANGGMATVIPPDDLPVFPIGDEDHIERGQE